MQDLQARLLGAVLAGDGLQGLVDLAAVEAGGPVAIVLPARGVSVGSPEGDDLESHTVEVEVPVLAGQTEIGAVRMLAAPNGMPAIDREEVARATALAAVTEVAMGDARDEVEHDLRASLVEDLRHERVDGAEVARRAGRLGCDLENGALALVAEIRTRKPRGAAALIETEWPGALAELAGEPPERVYALMPSTGPNAGPEKAGRSVHKLLERLRSYGLAAASSFYADPGDLHQAMREAELVLEVTRRDERLAEQIEAGTGDSVYRLLFRALISDPDEVRSFYEETVAPVVEHDRGYRAELLATLEAYLAHDCNMNATARAIFAHRHTVAYRLERVKELTGLDPSSGDDRERLGLGIKAFRILEPDLPR
jgi:sugar diacid utilization regulator